MHRMARQTPTTSLFLLLLCLPASSIATTSQQADSSWNHWFSSLWRRDDRNVPPEGFYNPYDYGGSLLTIVENTFPEGQGEPANIIISGASDEEVLVDQEVDGGLRNYFLSLHFSGECLGQSLGSKQKLDLGDGNGPMNQTAVIRYNYGDPSLGACRESIEGGNHFRYWVQNGPERNSGAYFLAASFEMPISLQHDIVPNGYNLGRDAIVGNITNSTVPTLTLTNGTSYSGYTWSDGWTYYTEVTYLAGMLQNTSDGINHNLTVMTPESNATDGLVALFRVGIHERPESSSATMLAPPILFTILVAYLLSSMP